MKYDIIPTGQFKKDVKLAHRRGYDLERLTAVINALAEGQTLDAGYRDHALTGNFSGFRECHIQPDWLLIYQIDRGRLVLILSRTGTHSDLFQK